MVHRSHSNSFSDLAAFLSAPPSNFLAKAREESSIFESVGCFASRKQEHIEHITERCLIAQKNLVSRNKLRESENIGARDVDVLIANFLLQVREFLFLICVKKTISMKILVLRVINSSRHRNCFVQGYAHSLFVSKALTRSYLARSGFRTNNS